ncbi:hypothetical protein, partial [Methylobacterium goesingense]|uniref:hypothetical protein n=1 Tax=Methylobacterium goesingense TaxID=243690 RepID=UPI003643F115
CQQSSHDPHYRNPQEQIRRPRFSFSDSLVKEQMPRSKPRQTPIDKNKSAAQLVAGATLSVIQ